MICLTQENISKLKNAIQSLKDPKDFFRMPKEERATFLNEVLQNKQVSDWLNTKMELALETGRKKVIEKAFKEMFTPEIREVKNKISEQRKTLLDEKRALEREINKSEKEITPKEKEAKKDKLASVEEKIANTTDIKIVDRILEDYQKGKTDYITGAFEKAFSTELTNGDLDKLYNISLELKELKKAPSDNIFGRPNKEYYQKIEELRKIFDQQKNIQTFKTLYGTITVGSLLLGVKSSIVNNFSNFLSAGVEIGVSRIKHLQFRNKNTDLISEYVKYAQDTYLASGVNISRITDSKDISNDMDYLLPYGSLENMKASTRTQEVIKKWATAYEKTIFTGRIAKDKADNVFGKTARMASLGYSDASFSAFNFADEVVAIANKMAKKEGATDIKARSREIALDIFQAATTNVDYRLMSQADMEYHGSLINALEKARYRAEVAVFQDDNAVNKLILSTRDGLNKFLPDLSIGTNVAIFVKTPINVWILKTYRYSGLESMTHIVSAIHEKYKTGTVSEETVSKIADSVARTGISTVLATIMASIMLNMKGDDDDDPLYSVSYNTATPDLRKIYTEKNIPYNSFRIGSQWFSADYFGGTSSLILNLLDREYNKNKDLTLLEKTGAFFSNNLSGWESLPIIEELYGAVNYKTSIGTYRKDMEDIAQDTFKYLAEIASRPIKVGILTDLSKIIDSQKRAIDYGSGWTIPIQQVAQIMPVISKLLEERYSFAGEKLNQSSAINQILFGARTGTEKDNLVVDELYRLTRDNANLSLGIESKQVNGYGVKKTLDEMGLPFPQRNRIEAIINKNIFNTYSGIIVDNGTEYKEKNDYLKVEELNKSVLKAVKNGLEEAGILEEYEEFTDKKKEADKEAKRLLKEGK